MASSQVLVAIVASWLTGPLYGMNLVLVIYILLKISRKLRCSVARTFALYSVFLLITCTTQVIVALIIMLAAFDGPIRFARIAPPVLTTTLVMYCVNISFSQVLIIWRVYAVSGRKILLTSIFAITSLAFIGLSAVIVWKFSDDSNLFSGVRSVRILSITAWAVSFVFQGFGSGFIIWKTCAIPVEVHHRANSSKSSRIIVSILFMAVDSGCILPLMEFIALILDGIQLQSSLIATVSVLGQLSAFVPLTIVLRESIKADHDLRKNMVNATSTFLVSRIPVAEANQRGPIITASAPMLVDIQQTEHKQFDLEEEISMSDKFDNNSAVCV